MKTLTIQEIAERYPHILAECQEYLSKYPDSKFIHHPSGRLIEHVKVEFVREDGRGFSFPIKSFYRGPRGVQRPGIPY